MNDSLDITKDLSVANHIISELDIFYYNQLFYHFENNYWKPYSRELVKKKILDILAEKYTQGRVNNILDIIQLNIIRQSDEINLNTQKNWINVKNGMYSLSEKKLIKHSPDTKLLYSTNLFPLNFNSKAKYDRWERFIDEIFQHDHDKEDKKALLQEFLGLCLTPNVTYQKAMLLLGNGSNGKSIAITVLENILGVDNYSSIELNQLSNKNYIVELQNKLVNFCSEIDHKGNFSSGIFKRIVSGDTVTGDAKFKAPIKFNPYSKLLFATNDLPKTNDTTRGYFRRILILKFNRNFEGAEKDPYLANKLLSELDGIFNWLLIGLERLLKNEKFTSPISSETELDDYLESSNSVVSFIREKCEIKNDPTYWERAGEFYDTYKLYCTDSKLHPFSNPNFKNEMKKHYHPKIEWKKDGNSGRRYKHVKIKKDI